MSKTLRLSTIAVMLLMSVILLFAVGLPYDSFSALASSLLQYESEKTPEPTVFITELEVEDQDVNAGVVLIKRVNAGIRSWILIHNQINGAVGDQIGAGIVLFGESKDVVIPIELDNVTPVLYASLYADWGQKEVYDPELDVQTFPPTSFNVEYGTSTPEVETPTPMPTPKPITAPSPTPTPVPEEETRDMPFVALIAIVCLVALLVGGIAGAGLFYFLRRQSSDDPIDFKEEFQKVVQRLTQRGGSDSN